MGVTVLVPVATLSPSCRTSRITDHQLTAEVDGVAGTSDVIRMYQVCAKTVQGGSRDTRRTISREIMC